ncbi:MAG: serine/threonine-protein kinase [Phycisphaeraceae bacterium]
MERKAIRLPTDMPMVVQRVIRQTRIAHDDPARLLGSTSWQPDGPPVDQLFVLPGDPCDPADVFPRLRWGGQVVILSCDPCQLHELSHAYQGRSGFALEIGPRTIHTGPLGGCLPFLRKTWRYIVARKVALIPPGKASERFTFAVELIKPPSIGHYAVLKRVPTYGSIMVRLQKRFPQTPHANLAKRARKLVDRVFPLFLTREAAFLRLLQRDLPEHLRDRVPQVLGVQRGPDGLVHKLCMTWLRLATQPIPQLQFALQLAQFVQALHDQVKLVHLDLRMDNIIITREGVGLIDFGSAVRMDEDLADSPLLLTLFGELMSTSHIQRLLGRMTSEGTVTSQVLVKGHHKVDRAADLFHLSMLMAQPTGHPDLSPLIAFDAESLLARRISALSDHVLRPTIPDRPDHTNAADIVRGLQLIAAEHDPTSPPSEK